MPRISLRSRSAPASEASSSRMSSRPFGDVASYALFIEVSAAKELEDVEPRSHRARIAGRIQALAQTPRPPGSQKLAGDEGRYHLWAPLPSRGSLLSSDRGSCRGACSQALRAGSPSSPWGSIDEGIEDRRGGFSRLRGNGRRLRL